MPTPITPGPAAAPPNRVLPGYGSHPPVANAPGSGPVVVGTPGPVEVHEGDENAFAFSFFIEPTVYRAPGADNLIMQFKGGASESPSFGLQLWDDGSGGRGLWSSGDAMGGERFLALVAEGVWHEAVVYFQASAADDGFYLLTLDGRPIDARALVGLIDPESSYARIEVGLFRDGERVVAPSEIAFGPARLDTF